MLSRSSFWLLLLGWNALKWQIWFAFTIRRPSDWTRAALIGSVVLNAVLPLEISAALAIVGFTTSLNAPRIWLPAALISAAIFPVIWFMSRRLGGSAAHTSVTCSTGGLLERARVEPQNLIAIEAEDHYCRLRRRNGSDALIHYRFGDALAEVAGMDGAQVRRGVWLAASAIAGATRKGRRWLLVLADGTRVPVSATFVSAVRARGWLNR